MFKVRSNVITSKKALFQTALNRLPDAHEKAHEAGLSHLHDQVRGAAEDAGLSSESIVRNGNEIAIDDSESGNQLFDREYGTVDEAPNPVLAPALRAAIPEGLRRYKETLYREMRH